MDPTLGPLRQAVQANPGARSIRLLLVERLLAAGLTSEAIEHLATLVRADPSDMEANALLSDALTYPLGPAAPPNGAEPATPEPYDWAAAAADLGEPDEADTVGKLFDADTVPITLANVGGMEPVKQRLEAAFLAPLRNPELRALYGKSLRGGLLLYGPPGCGKTYIARALAGEMVARFVAVGISDVLGMWLGESEANIHELFEQARRSAPTVLFIDELDALGGRRNLDRGPSHASITNQLLLELDGMGAGNDNVFIIGATNRPWDIDPALKRPGRFDRMVFVGPPDAPAREAILREHLRDRPVDIIEVGWLAAHSEGFSGADLAAVCDAAAERGLLDAVASGTVSPITMRHLRDALRDVHPSTGAWFDAVRPILDFDQSGGYDDLREFLRKRRR